MYFGKGNQTEQTTSFILQIIQYNIYKSTKNNPRNFPIE